MFRETSVVSTVRPIRCGTSTKLETPVIDQSTTSVQSSNKIDILVAGSVAIDLSCDYTPFETSSNQSPKRYTSNPAAISQSIGGVGHNVAIAAHLINGQASVQLCSLVADDLAGGLILSALNDRGLNIKAIKVLETDNQTRTAQYVAVNKTNKDLEVAMADMNIVDTPRDDFSSVWQPIIDAAEPKWIVVDANWDAPKLKEWFVAAKSAGANVAFEPVSVAKASRLFPPVTGLR